MVVRNLAADMVEDMSLRKAMSRAGTNPSHKAAEVSKQAAVHGGKSTAGESELRSAIMREKRIRVLKEGDQNNPVIDPT